MPAPAKPTREELRELLTDLLVQGSLYKRLTYDGSEAHNFVNQMHGGMARFGWLPKQLKMYCAGENCHQETLWEVPEDRIYFTSDVFHKARYICRNCQRKMTTYWFLWTEEKGISTFTKVGQYPPLTIEPSPELTKALGKEDAELYKKALINGNFAFGIGALAYFRRVIENKVNMLLDLIGEAAKLANFETEELQRLEEIKGSHHVDAKIEYASKILPPHLRPGGHNPLNKLFAVASSGIHGKSDEQCLDDFHNARFEFEYLFKNLTVTNEDAREYLKRVSGRSRG